MDMITGKNPRKKSGEKTQEKKEIAIHAVLSKSLHLTQREEQALAKALTVAGKTFVENLKSKNDEVIQIIANHER